MCLCMYVCDPMREYEKLVASFGDGLNKYAWDGTGFMIVFCWAKHLKCFFFFMDETIMNVYADHHIRLQRSPLFC